ncbi:hypothetical protein ADUPG1_009020, partial [Aduncisulcus paluster]
MSSTQHDTPYRRFVSPYSEKRQKSTPSSIQNSKRNILEPLVVGESRKSSDIPLSHSSAKRASLIPSTRVSLIVDMGTSSSPYKKPKSVLPKKSLVPTEGDKHKRTRQILQTPLWKRQQDEASRQHRASILHFAASLVAKSDRDPSPQYSSMTMTTHDDSEVKLSSNAALSPHTPTKQPPNSARCHSSLAHTVAHRTLLRSGSSMYFSPIKPLPDDLLDHIHHKSIHNSDVSHNESSLAESTESELDELEEDQNEFNEEASKRIKKRRDAFGKSLSLPPVEFAAVSQKNQVPVSPATDRQDSFPLPSASPLSQELHSEPKSSSVRALFSPNSSIKKDARGHTSNESPAGISPSIHHHVSTSLLLSPSLKMSPGAILKEHSNMSEMDAYSLVFDEIIQQMEKFSHMSEEHRVRTGHDANDTEVGATVSSPAPSHISVQRTGPQNSTVSLSGPESDKTKRRKSILKKKMTSLTMSELKSMSSQDFKDEDEYDSFFYPPVPESKEGTADPASGVRHQKFVVENINSEPRTQEPITYSDGKRRAEEVGQARLEETQQMLERTDTQSLIKIHKPAPSPQTISSSSVPMSPSSNTINDDFSYKDFSILLRRIKSFYVSRLCGLPDHIAHLVQQREEARAEVRRLKKKVRDLLLGNEKAEATVKQLTDESQVLESNLKEVGDERDSLTSDNKRLYNLILEKDDTLSRNKRDIAQLQDDVTDLHRKLERVLSQLVEVRTLYEGELRKNTSLKDVVASLRRELDIAETSAQKLQDEMEKQKRLFQIKLQDVGGEKDYITTQYTRIERKLKETKAKRDELEQLTTQLEAALTDANEEIQAMDKDLKKLGVEREGLAQRILKRSQATAITKQAKISLGKEGINVGVQTPSDFMKSDVEYHVQLQLKSIRTQLEQASARKMNEELSARMEKLDREH